jgi:pimeloyl-ACP methyl ester carboxylesterase
MAPVAKELASQWGVVEPLQTAMSVEGQIQELHDLIMQHADPPVAIIGSSWGAMLGLLLTAGHPTLVRKLILVGSGPLEESYAAQIEPTRMARLSEEERREIQHLMTALQASAVPATDAQMARLGELFGRTDAYDPEEEDDEVLECQPELHRRVWHDAWQRRCRGEFVAAAKRIECPVVAIHGDYDPHPAEGVEQPLAHALKAFRFIRLARCGHLPWIERQARVPFYVILREELSA